MSDIIRSITVNGHTINAFRYNNGSLGVSVYNPNGKLLPVIDQPADVNEMAERLLDEIWLEYFGETAKIARGEK
jgi:hypothetical protein